MSEKGINDLIHTGEIAKSKVSDEMLKAAESHADQRIEDLKEENSKRKKMLIKLGAMMTLTVLILIFTTMHMQIKQMTAETA